MATDKKSFVLYADLLHTVKHLSKEQTGDLFIHLLEYVNDKNPETNDPLIKIAFEPIKQSLKRDLKRWESKQAQRAEAGRLGGLARAENAKQKQANEATAKKTKRDKANQAVNGSGSVNGSVSVSENVNTDDDVYKNIDTHFQRYIANDKLIKAVIDNNDFKSRAELEKRLREFNKHLAANDEFSKTWKDYTSHFRYWHKKQKSNTKSPTDITL